MNIRFYEHKSLLAEFKSISPEDILKLLKRHSKTPELLPEDPADLWAEGQQQTTHGHIEWSTEKELTT